MADFTILILPMSYASGVAATLDVLQAAALLALRSMAPMPTWRVMSPAGGTVTLSAGMQILTEALPRKPSRDQSIWIVPGLGLDNAKALVSGLASTDGQRAIRALAFHASRDGRIAGRFQDRSATAGLLN